MGLLLNRESGHRNQEDQSLLEKKIVNKYKKSPWQKDCLEFALGWLNDWFVKLRKSTVVEGFVLWPAHGDHEQSWRQHLDVLVLEHSQTWPWVRQTLSQTSQQLFSQSPLALLRTFRIHSPPRKERYQIPVTKHIHRFSCWCYTLRSLARGKDKDVRGTTFLSKNIKMQNDFGNLTIRHPCFRYPFKRITVSRFYPRVHFLL